MRIKTEGGKTSVRFTRMPYGGLAWITNDITGAGYSARLTKIQASRVAARLGWHALTGR